MPPVVDRSIRVGEWDRAASYCTRLADLQIALLGRVTIPHTFFGVGVVELLRGRREEAVAIFDEGRRLAPEEQRSAYDIGLAPFLASDDIARGAPDEALKRLEHLCARDGLHPADAVDIKRLAAWAYADLGRTDEARRLVDESIATAEQYCSLAMQNEVKLTRGHVAARAGRREQAVIDFAAVVQLAHDMPDPYVEAQGLYYWVTSLPTAEKTSSESQRLEEALAIFRRLGAQPYADLTEHALKSVAQDVR